MADVHRKIELQEPEDLRYLVNNARRAANEKLDEHLPRLEGGGEDLYRQKVEELVHEYINSTFTAASQNILINGQVPSDSLLSNLLSATSTSDPQDQVEEYEPLDTKLADRATSLKVEEDALLMEIATLKKEAYVKGAAAWNESYKKGVEVDDEVLRVAEGFKDGEDVKVDVGERERQGRVERSWERGVEGLERLKVEMPGTMARMERARAAEEYVLKEGKGKAKAKN